MNLPGTELTTTDLQALERDGVSTAMALQCRLRSVTSIEGGTMVGRNGAADYSGIAIPNILPGQPGPRVIRLRRHKPEYERQEDGKLKPRNKYLSPPGGPNVAYFVPGTPLEWLTDASLPVLLMEGEKKCMAGWEIAHHGLGDAAEKPRWLPMALPGVWNFRGKIGKTGGPNGERCDETGPIPDLDRIDFLHRDVIINFDTNVRNNGSVQAARWEFTKLLRSRGASVRWADWPADTPEAVNGIDDYVAIAGHEACIRMIEEATPAPIKPFDKTAHSDARPVALSVADVLAIKPPERRTLIEPLLPASGAVLLVGTQKSGKTVVAVQMAIAIASGHPFMDNYRVTKKGGVILVEQDDPAGDLSMQDYFKASPISVDGVPLSLFVRIDKRFGPDFDKWLEQEIQEREARAVVLDSHTTLRPHRKPGIDIVKVESEELTGISAVGKRTGCLIIVISHDSKAGFGRDWSDRTAGTYAQGAAVEGQMHISRFRELPDNAPERLLRVRGRHIDDAQLLLRFRRPTLDYSLVLEGPAAPLYPDLLAIIDEFVIGDTNSPFTPKDLCHSTGMSRATAMRNISHMLSAGAIIRRGHGEYMVSTEVLLAVRSGGAR